MIFENNPICKDKQWLKYYLRWNIEHLYDKWQSELQNLWNYKDTYLCIKNAKHWPQLLLYEYYCKEKSLREKWSNNFPDLEFVLVKINEEVPFFNPCIIDNCEKYFNFLIKIRVRKRKNEPSWGLPVLRNVLTSIVILL